MSRLRGWPLRLTIAALVVVLLLGGGALAFVLTREGDVSNPTVEFHADTPTPSPTPTATPKKGKKKVDPADTFVWPFYGYGADRRSSLAGNQLRPPYAWLWTMKAHALLEFPPALANGVLYLLDDDGYLWAVGTHRGNVRWKRHLGALAASSPAYGDGRLYVTILARAKGQPGRVVALRAKDGKILWSKNLPSRSESSPLLDSGRVYFGSEDGTVYSLRADNGGQRWTFHAAGAVKGGLALDNDTLYFGDYAGKVYAIRRADGKLVWSTGTS